MKRLSVYLLLLAILTLTFACTKKETPDESESLNRELVQDSSDIVASTDGFSGPEAVRYDPVQDVYFVSNFNGAGNERDGNGFISKVSADGSLDSLRFMVGTESMPLHAPRGMYITGDTLWAADIDGIHGFNRITAEQIAFIDFLGLDPGFLNDIAQGSDGHLYVTDTGNSVVYRIKNRAPSIIVDSLSASPNGITLDPKSKKLILAPWGGGTTFYSLEKDSSVVSEFVQAQSGGNFDGIEFASGHLLAASQNDSSLHALYEGTDRISIKVPGRPADIGIDTKRNRVAIPYIDLNRIDIWQLPD